MRKAIRSARKTADVPAELSPESALELARLWNGPRMMLKQRKRIRPDEKVAVELNDRERDLIRNDSFADEELTGRLRIMPKPGQAPLYRFTLDELDELAGHVAAEANHAKDKRRQKTWDRIYERISAVLGSYTDEDD